MNGGNICENCGKNFANKFSLKVHINSVHLKIKKFPCFYCPYKGADKTSLDRHVHSYHIERGELLCDICGKRFFEKFKLERHKKIHSDPKEICSYCGFSFRIKANLDQHVKNVHLKQYKIFSCSFCDYTAKKKCYLIQHVTKYHSKEETLDNSLQLDFTCSICDLNYLSQRKLLDHFQSTHRTVGDHQIQSSETQNKSSDSPDQFKDELTLMKHESEKTRIKSLPPDDVSCNNSDEARAITKGKNRRKKKCQQVQCLHCNSLYANKYALQNHVNAVHLGMKKFHCDLCNFKTASRGALTRHITSLHNENKSHLCDTCGKSFNASHKLKRHKIIHLNPGEMCETCGKSFKVKAELRRHIKELHMKTGKSIKCHKCDYTCSRNFHLKRHHDIIHEGIKKFSCHICGKKMAVKCNLEKHLKNVHHQ